MLKKDLLWRVKMAFEITPSFASKSLIIVLISYVLAFGFQIFMMYLNWKQSRVNNQMKELIKEVKEIKELLKDVKEKKS